MGKIRFGVLSTARIGTAKVIPALQRGEWTEVTAIASRDQGRARAAADALGIAQAYGSYEELLADPEVDAVYNPLPNNLHVPLSLAALAAGKHVLCEKPIAMSAAEAETLLEASRARPDLKVMEAFMYRHHPQWRRAKGLVDEGAIGQLRSVHSAFSYYNDDPANIRNMAAAGGGGMMDIGCYNLSLSRFLFGEEPRRVCASVELDPRFQTDRLVSGLLEFGRGTASFTCSTQLAPYQRVQIFGTAGRVEIEIPFNAPPDRPCRIWLERGAELEAIAFPVCDQYTLQGDAFALAILEGRPVPTPLEDAVANMRALEAVLESGRSGSWVAL